MFFESTRKLISKLDQFFTKSKNIGENKVSLCLLGISKKTTGSQSFQRKSYDDMKKDVRKIFSGLSKDQQMIASFIIYTYGIGFFPFLNGKQLSTFAQM